MKYGIWTSSKNVNETLINAFKEKKDNPELVLLMFFKIKGEPYFVGCAELISNYIYEQQYNYWLEKEEWKGLFNLKWIFVKTVYFMEVFPQFTLEKSIEQLNNKLILPMATGAHIYSLFLNKQYQHADSIF